VSTVDHPNSRNRLYNDANNADHLLRDEPLGSL
jgi:hypothetical protein